MTRYDRSLAGTCSRRDDREPGDTRHRVGTRAGDLISEIALAIEMGADAVDIGKTIHPHPTLSESVGFAAEVFEGVCTDLPPVRKNP